MKFCKHFPKDFELPILELLQKSPRSCKICGSKKRSIFDIELNIFRCECQFQQITVAYHSKAAQFKCYICKLNFCLEKSRYKTLLSIPSRVLGCTGLINLGNTCFINVILQVFSNLVPVYKLFTKYVSNVLTDLPEHPKLRLVKELCKVIYSLWQGSPSVEPKHLIQEFDLLCGTLSRKRHQDTQEFFKFFYNSLEESLNKYLKTQFLKDCFLWKINTKIICQKCSSSKNSTEELIELPLSIPRKNELNALRVKSNECLSDRDKIDMKKVSNGVFKKIKLYFKSNTTKVVNLYDCLVEYFKDELMNDPKNLIFCEKCGSEQVSVKTPKIETMPCVLTLQFKRYLSSSKKYPIHIQMPVDLDLSRFTESSSKIYRLTCLVSHRGDLNSGHYIAYCKNRRNNSWYKFDDKSVTLLTEEEVLNQQVYLAFYTEQYQRRKFGLDPNTFVPIEWSVKYSYLNSPGEYDLSQYFCIHEKVSIEFPSSTFIKVNYEEVKMFSKNNLKLESVEQCTICFQKIEKNKELCKKESELIHNLYKGSNDFIINGLWWANWENFIKNGKVCPGKINNIDVQSKLGKVGTKIHRVSKGTWTALLILYSADMQIVQQGFLYEQTEITKEKLEEFENELEIPIRNELKMLVKEKLSNF